MRKRKGCGRELDCEEVIGRDAREKKKNGKGKGCDNKGWGNGSRPSLGEKSTPLRTAL